LSLFVLAIAEVAAGIGSLATSLSPLMMTVIGATFYKKKLTIYQIIGLVLGIIGVWVAVLPLLGQHFATWKGLILLFVSMISYSIAALFYADQQWTLTRYAINGWQVFFGAIFLLPITIFYNHSPIRFTSNAIISILWLAIPVSVISVNIWLRLLKIDTARASFFLFLTPFFGFMIASYMLGEPFTIETLIGLVLVLGGLYLGQRE
jgi:probable blue pigment (indigoidine) exporter